MKQAIFSRMLLATAVLLFSILTCYGQEDPYEQVAGTWTKSVGERTITFTLKADHTYEVDYAGDEGIDVYGDYEISGTRITFNDEDRESGAPGAPGIYDFKLSDASLVFKWVDDPAEGRSTLVEGSWSKAADD